MLPRNCLVAVCRIAHCKVCVASEVLTTTICLEACGTGGTLTAICALLTRRAMSSHIAHTRFLRVSSGASASPQRVLQDTRPSALCVTDTLRQRREAMTDLCIASSSV